MGHNNHRLFGYSYGTCCLFSAGLPLNICVWFRWMSVTSCGWTLRSPDSNLAQWMWDLWGSDQPCYRFFSRYSCFTLSISFHQYCALIFVFILMSEGQAGRSLGISKQNNALSDTGERWTENESSYTLSFAASLPKVSLQFMFLLPVTIVT